MADMSTSPCDVGAFRRARFFLDATPLLDNNWTGISVVCANVARQLLRRGLHLEFCLEGSVIPRKAMLGALERSSGLYVAHELATGRLPTATVAMPRDAVCVGLSASTKRFNRIFDVECSWIHDISTLLQPEFHTTDNIAWHAESIIEDLASNDLTVCVSQATLEDLVAYLGADRKKLIMIHNGVEWPWWYAAKAKNERVDLFDPYFLILGTREPRKNLRIVFDMLATFPDVLDAHRVVLVGQEGLLVDPIEIAPELASAIEAGRLSITGFVSDYDKYRLIAGATATVFPSVFEGFGLPILESLSIGTPCVASCSSSLTEVGGALCEYFDPFSVTSLHNSLQNIVRQNLKENISFQSAAEIWTRQFSWSGALDTVLNALVPHIEKFNNKPNFSSENSPASEVGVHR